MDIYTLTLGNSVGLCLKWLEKGNKVANIYPLNLCNMQLCKFLSVGGIFLSNLAIDEALEK